ncbi:MAG: hypothetical protein SOT90_02975 [Muribaculaceae bacterium]|nr:hypothetical protein [Muribaculaceae bacterium]
MKILINGKLAALKENTSFEYIADNRLFSGSDGYSLTITFPLRGCSQNLAIFGNINRADVAANKVIFDCQIIDRALMLHGSIVVTEISQAEVKTQFLEGRSEVNFDTTFDDIYINELDLGSPTYITASSITPMNAWNKGVTDLTFVALPWVNDASGNIQNCTRYLRTSYLWHTDTKGLSWQPYLLYIVKKICEAVGYSYDFTAWEEKEEHRYLLICNTLPYAWNIPGFADALPHWSVSEFFEKLELFLDAEFDIDHRSRHIGFAYSKDILAALPPVAIDKVIDEHTVEVTVEDDNCEYRESKNLVYAECDHELWKFYSCDWYIKSFGAKAVQYNTLSALLAANKDYATWNGTTARGSRLNSLLYAKDLDMYFVIRAIEKTLVEERENLPNRYSYKCILQPVNLFGGRIVDDSEDADSNVIEFVPAWVDYTDSTFGRCLFLAFSGYDETDSSGNTSFVRGESSEERKQRIDNTFFQPLAVQNIEAGEKNKKSEYYDKIYIGWWDAAANYNGKLPFPFTEDIVIAEDWGSYFRPHTSLRLNNKILNQYRKVYQVNPKQKATFKFLSDTIPNPRSLFIIRGKRYVCEKLTATFTSQGMSQLIKGSFYPIPN